MLNAKETASIAKLRAVMADNVGTMSGERSAAFIHISRIIARANARKAAQTRVQATYGWAVGTPAASTFTAWL